jgi:hypothetical protein
MRTRMIFRLVAAVALGGCAPSMVWQKYGITQEQANIETAQCKLLAQYTPDPGTIPVPPMANATSQAWMNYSAEMLHSANVEKAVNNTYNLCMQAKGWTLVPARASSSYGAIAWDRMTGRSGWSWSQATAERASELALSQCGDSGCKVVLQSGPGQCTAYNRRPQARWRSFAHDAGRRADGCARQLSERQRRRVRPEVQQLQRLGTGVLSLLQR